MKRYKKMPAPKILNLIFVSFSLALLSLARYTTCPDNVVIV
jgi:hypothetical protein